MFKFWSLVKINFTAHFSQQINFLLQRTPLTFPWNECAYLQRELGKHTAEPSWWRRRLRGDTKVQITNYATGNFSLY